MCIGFRNYNFKLAIFNLWDIFTPKRLRARYWVCCGRGHFENVVVLRLRMAVKQEPGTELTNYMVKDETVSEQQSYINELQDQLTSQSADSLAATLISKEIEKVKNGVSSPDQRYLDVISGRPYKICYKVLIPVEQFPKFNFVGKILGPKGNSLKRLQEQTGTRMAVLGRGSMRDKIKEDQMRLEGGKYEHLNEPLHVWIEAYAQPSDALNRMAHAISEVKKYINPDYNDDIRQQQLEELVTLGEMTGRGRAMVPRGMPMQGPPRPSGPPRGPIVRGGLTRPPLRSPMGRPGPGAYPRGAMAAPQVRPAAPASTPMYSERYDYSSEQDYSADYSKDEYANSSFNSTSSPAARPSAYAGGNGDNSMDGFNYSNDNFNNPNSSNFGKVPQRGRGDFRTRPY